MIKNLAFIVIVIASCQSAMAQLGMRTYRCCGYLKCMDGSGEIEGTCHTKRARDCDFCHEELEQILRRESILVCTNGSTAQYFDDGCEELYRDEHGVEQVLNPVETPTNQQWTVELVYTFEKGGKKGVSRRGGTYCEAFLKARQAMCDKQDTYGRICPGTGSAYVKMPGQAESSPICAPYSLLCAPPTPTQPCMVQQCAPQTTNCFRRLRLLRR